MLLGSLSNVLCVMMMVVVTVMLSCKRRHGCG
jgi:hypothetical protein